MSKVPVPNRYQLSRQCLKVLLHSPQLLLFPVLTIISVPVILLIIAAIVIQPFFGLGARGSGIVAPILIFVLFVPGFYIFRFVSIFWNAALIAGALRRIRGEGFPFIGGILDALRRSPKLIGFSRFSTKIVRTLESGSSSPDLLAQPVFTYWRLLEPLALPVVMAEDHPMPEATLQQSFELFDKTWGIEDKKKFTLYPFTARHIISLSVVAFSFIFVHEVNRSAGFLEVGDGLLIAALLVGLSIVPLFLMNAVANRIFWAAVYVYAATGDAGRYFDETLLAQAFGGDAKGD